MGDRSQQAVVDAVQDISYHEGGGTVLTYDAETGTFTAKGKNERVGPNETPMTSMAENGFA